MPLKQVGVKPFLDPAIGHQLEKSFFIFTPWSVLLLVAVEKKLGWCQQRFVAIDGMAEFSYEEVKVVTFRKACKLRYVV